MVFEAMDCFKSGLDTFIFGLGVSSQVTCCTCFIAAVSVGADKTIVLFATGLLLAFCVLYETDHFHTETEIIYSETLRLHFLYGNF